MMNFSTKTIFMFSIVTIGYESFFFRILERFFFRRLAVVFIPMDTAMVKVYSFLEVMNPNIISSLKLAIPKQQESRSVVFLRKLDHLFVPLTERSLHKDPPRVFIF